MIPISFSWCLLRGHRSQLHYSIPKWYPQLRTMTSSYKYSDIKLGILRVHIKKEFASTISHLEEQLELMAYLVSCKKQRCSSKRDCKVPVFSIGAALCARTVLLSEHHCGFPQPCIQYNRCLSQKESTRSSSEHHGWIKMCFLFVLMLFPLTSRVTVWKQKWFYHHLRQVITPRPGRDWDIFKDLSPLTILFS